MTSAAVLLLKTTTAKYPDVQAAGQRLRASWGAAATAPHAKGSGVTQGDPSPQPVPETASAVTVLGAGQVSTFCEV